LSHEWEKILDENKELSIKLNLATKEINKLREVENSLYKTLKTAADTGANVIEQANKAAELQIKEAKMKAEKMINDADLISKSMVEKAEKEALEILNKMLDDVKELEQNFHRIESVKENLVSELKNLANDALERVQKFSKKSEDIDIKQYITKAREVASNFKTDDFAVAGEEEKDQQETSTEDKPEEPLHDSLDQEGETSGDASRETVTETDKEEDGEEKSFFDSIG
jgi:cell division initiation protein